MADIVFVLQWCLRFEGADNQKFAINGYHFFFFFSLVTFQK